MPVCSWPTPARRNHLRVQLSVRPKVDASKATHSATGALDAVALLGTEHVIHNARQSAQKGPPCAAAAALLPRRFREKTPKFFARNVGGGIRREVFLSKAPNRTVPWCGIAFIRHLVLWHKLVQELKCAADNVDFRFRHIPVTTTLNLCRWLRTFSGRSDSYTATCLLIR